MSAPHAGYASTYLASGSERVPRSEPMAPTADVARDHGRRAAEVAARESGVHSSLGDDAPPPVSGLRGFARSMRAPRPGVASAASPNAASASASGGAVARLEEAATAARDAGLAFLEGVRSGFDKHALATWLIGPYQHAASFATSALAGRESQRRPAPISIELLTPLPLVKVRKQGSRAVSVASPSVSSSMPFAHVVRAEALDSILYRARVQALAALEGASHSRSRPAFVQEALDRGYVVAADIDGVTGFFPRDLPKMHLRDRVLSLFAADHLARPADYATKLLVCPWCERARFDAATRERGMCADHDRPSGVVDRTRASSSASRAANAQPRQAERDEGYERAVRAVLEDDARNETDVTIRRPMRALSAG